MRIFLRFCCGGNLATADNTSGHRRCCCSVLGGDVCSPKVGEFAELSDSCLYIDSNRHKTVGDLKETIMILIGRGAFNLSSRENDRQSTTPRRNGQDLLLRLRGYLVPGTQPVELLRDNDELEVCLHVLNKKEAEVPFSPECIAVNLSKSIRLHGHGEPRHASKKVASETSSDSSLEETSSDSSAELQEQFESQAQLTPKTTTSSVAALPLHTSNQIHHRQLRQQIRPGHVILGSSSSSESDSEEIPVRKAQKKQCGGPAPLPLQKIRNQRQGGTGDVEPSVSASQGGENQTLDGSQDVAPNSSLSDSSHEAFVPWDGPISPLLEGRWLRAQLLQLQNGYPQLSNEKIFRVVQVDVEANRVMLDGSHLSAANAKRQRCGQERSQRGRWYNWSQVTGKKLRKEEAAELAANLCTEEGQISSKCSRKSPLQVASDKDDRSSNATLSNLGQHTNGASICPNKYVPLRELKSVDSSTGVERNASRAGSPSGLHESRDVPYQHQRDVTTVDAKEYRAKASTAGASASMQKDDLFPWIASVVVHAGGSPTQPELLLTSPPLGTLQLPGGESWLREHQGQRLLNRSAVQKQEVNDESIRHSVVAAAVDAAAKVASERGVESFALLAECDDILPLALLQKARRLVNQRFAQLRAAVRRQMDWYFSQTNWEKDSFLRDQSVTVEEAIDAAKGSEDGSNEANDIDLVALGAATAALEAASLHVSGEAMQNVYEENNMPCDELRVVPLKTLMDFPRMQRLTRDRLFVAYCVRSGGGLRNVAVVAGGAALVRKAQKPSDC